MAVAEGGMPIALSFKCLVVAYLGIYTLQSLSMLISSNYYLITVNIFDGWVKGGIMMLSYELTAELAFPYGESLSTGFVLAVESILKWPFAMTLGVLNFNATQNTTTSNVE